MSYQTSNNVTIAANEMLGALKEKAQLASLYFTDIDKSIVKATNRDIVSPKGKHVAIMLSCTFDQSYNIDGMFKQIDQRIKSERNWIVALKGLTVVHYMLREGNSARVLPYLVRDTTGILNLSGFRDNASGGQGMEQARNVKGYAAYLEERIAACRDTGTDYLRVDERQKQSMKAFPLNYKDLMALLKVLEMLIAAKPYTDSVNNEVSAEIFRLMTSDMLGLFRILNQEVVDILKVFFELERPNALKALEVYERFAQLSTGALEWLDVARRIRIGDVPEVNHAPLSLAASLREYVNSSDFEIKRHERSCGAERERALQPAVVDVFNANASRQASNDAFVQARQTTNVDIFSPQSQSQQTIDLFAAPQRPQIQQPSQTQVFDLFAQPQNQVDLFGASEPQNQLVLRNNTSNAVDVFDSLSHQASQTSVVGPLRNDGHAMSVFGQGNQSAPIVQQQQRYQQQNLQQQFSASAGQTPQNQSFYAGQAVQSGMFASTYNQGAPTSSYQQSQQQQQYQFQQQQRPALQQSMSAPAMHAQPQNVFYGSNYQQANSAMFGNSGLQQGQQNNSYSSMIAQPNSSSMLPQQQSQSRPQQQVNQMFGNSSQSSMNFQGGQGSFVGGHAGMSNAGQPAFQPNYIGVPYSQNQDYGVGQQQRPGNDSNQSFQSQPLQHQSHVNNASLL